MKRLSILFVIMCAAIVAACGPSKAEQEKALQDSLTRDSLRYIDSLRAADSIAQTAGVEEAGIKEVLTAFYHNSFKCDSVLFTMDTTFANVITNAVSGSSQSSVNKFVNFHFWQVYVPRNSGMELESQMSEISEVKLADATHADVSVIVRAFMVKKGEKSTRRIDDTVKMQKYGEQWKICDIVRDSTSMMERFSGGSSEEQ